MFLKTRAEKRHVQVPDRDARPPECDAQTSPHNAGGVILTPPRAARTVVFLTTGLSLTVSLSLSLRLYFYHHPPLGLQQERSTRARLAQFVLISLLLASLLYRSATYHSLTLECISIFQSHIFNYVQRYRNFWTC